MYMNVNKNAPNKSRHLLVELNYSYFIITRFEIVALSDEILTK